MVATLALIFIDFLNMVKLCKFYQCNYKNFNNHNAILYNINIIVHRKCLPGEH